MAVQELSVREQIEALQARAHDLFEERIRVLQQITELEGALETVRHVRVDAPIKREEGLSPVFAAAVTDYLADHPGSPVGEIADGINSSHTRVTAALRRLEALHTVRRTGAAGGTKWYLAEDVADAGLRTTVGPVRDTRALIRDIAIELSAKGGGFTISDVEAACDVSYGTILRWLRDLVERGVLEVVDVQTEIISGGHPRQMWVKLYSYIEPKASPIPPRKPPPEEALKGYTPRQTGVVGGAPNWYKRMDQTARDFVKELEGVGCEIRPAKSSGHIKVYYQGKYVGQIGWLTKGNATSPAQISENRRQFIENGVPLAVPTG